MQKIKILLVTLLFFTPVLNAQEREYTVMVMGVPQHIINNGTRFEIDLPLKKNYRWITLAPQFYFLDKHSDAEGGLNHNYFESLVGGGLEVYSRVFLSRKNHGSGAYFSWGGGYRYLNLHTSDYIWNTYTENNLTYFQREPASFDVNVHSLTGRFVTGIQSPINDYLILDVFLGFGVKLGIHDRPENSFIKYNHGINDYGYTGTLLVAGFRLGVGL